MSQPLAGLIPDVPSLTHPCAAPQHDELLQAACVVDLLSILLAAAASVVIALSAGLIVVRRHASAPYTTVYVIGALAYTIAVAQVVDYWVGLNLPVR